MLSIFINGSAYVSNPTNHFKEKGHIAYIRQTTLNSRPTIKFRSSTGRSNQPIFYKTAAKIN